MTTKETHKMTDTQTTTPETPLYMRTDHAYRFGRAVAFACEVYKAASRTAYEIYKAAGHTGPIYREDVMYEAAKNDPHGWINAHFSPLLRCLGEVERTDVGRRLGHDFMESLLGLSSWEIPHGISATEGYQFCCGFADRRAERDGAKEVA